MTPLDRPKGSIGIGASLVDMVGGGWVQIGPPPNVSVQVSAQDTRVEGVPPTPGPAVCQKEKCV